MKNIILSILFITPALLYGQLDRSVRPEPAPAPTINIEDSEVFKTSNGITVILSENHKLPRVSFSLRMGATDKLFGDKAGLPGIAGDLIMSGTSNRSKDELDAEVDYIGARLSAGSSSLYLSCLTKHMNKGLDLMQDVLLNANFPQSEVDRIIKQAESGLLSVQSNPQAMANNARSKVNFPNHPYGEVMTEATLANIDRDAIVNYYKETFTPKESYLVIVGDINKEEAEKVVNKYFSSWDGVMPNTKALGTSGSTGGNQVYFIKKPGAVQSTISITFPMDIDPSSEDYLKLNVLNAVLGGGVFGNRLMQNLREDKAYTYGCRSRISVTEDGSYFSAGGEFRNEVSDSAITEILYELKRITTAPVEDDELNMTKAYMAGSFARSLEQPSTIANFALNIIKNNLPKDYYQTYLQKIEGYTTQDLFEVAKKYLTADNCNIVVVGNEEILDKLKQFDSDGKIVKLDAFGDPKKEILPADITKEELIKKYVSVITMTDSEKALNKKMKKFKSYEEVMEVSMDQIPFPMKMTQVWKAPNERGQKMEGQGMVFQRSYFDGEQGASNSMQGGKTEYTAEEIAAKKKSVGAFPEMNYSTSGMEYELLGIEERDGKMCYVLKTNDGSSEGYDYYDKETFYKVASVNIETNEGETTEQTVTFSDFKEQDGFIFPNEVVLSVGQGTFKGKVTSRTINAKIDMSSYQ